MSEKISISMDEVNSHEVDRQLSHQRAVARSTDHYQSQVAPSMPAAVAGNRSGSIWLNSVVYMTLFGLCGGLIAWPISEVSHQFFNGQSESFLQYVEERNDIVTKNSEGELSDEDALAAVEKLDERYQGNAIVHIITDDSLSEAERTEQVTKLSENNSTRSLFSTFVLCAVAGMAIAVCLSIADPVMSRNPREVIINGSVALCLGLLGGILVASFINALYRALGGGSGEGGLAMQILARSIGWGILGLFLATAPGLVMRSPKKLLIGIVGGFIGGLIGGGLFDVVAMTTGTIWMSRLISITAIGVLAGLGTGLIENAAKSGWMKVVAGLIAGKQFILYKNTTVIGSSPQCEIYLFKDVQVAPQHAAIHQVRNGFDLEDLGTTTGTRVNGSPVSRVRLKNNDQIQIGGTMFAFQEKAKS